MPAPFFVKNRYLPAARSSAYSTSQCRRDEAKTLSGPTSCETSIIWPAQPPCSGSSSTHRQSPAPLSVKGIQLTFHMTFLIGPVTCLGVELQSHLMSASYTSPDATDS